MNKKTYYKDTHERNDKFLVQKIYFAIILENKSFVDKINTENTYRTHYHPCNHCRETEHKSWTTPYELPSHCIYREAQREQKYHPKTTLKILLVLCQPFDCDHRNRDKKRSHPKTKNKITHTKPSGQRHTSDEPYRAKWSTHRYIV